MSIWQLTQQCAGIGAYEKCKNQNSELVLKKQNYKGVDVDGRKTNPSL